MVMGMQELMLAVVLQVDFEISRLVRMATAIWPNT